MRKMILIYGAAALLAGCALPTSIPVSPGAVAGSTTIDERAGLAAEGIYQSANLAGRVAIRLGANKASVAAIDNRAYAALLVARRAYAAGNRDGYEAALRDLNGIVKDMLALISLKEKPT